MPRIEVLKPGRDYKHDPPPTVDVCDDCSFEFTTDEPVPDALTDRHRAYKGHVVGSPECAHPNYDFNNTPCAICEDTLEEDRDG